MQNIIQNLQESIDKLKDILEEKNHWDKVLNNDKIPSNKYQWSLLTDKQIRELF